MLSSPKFEGVDMLVEGGEVRGVVSIPNQRFDGRIKRFETFTTRTDFNKSVEET